MAFNCHNKYMKERDKSRKSAGKKFSAKGSESKYDTIKIAEIKLV